MWQTLLVGLFMLLGGCTSNNSTDTRPPSTPTEKQEAKAPAASLNPDDAAANCTLCVKSNPLLVVDKDGAATGELNLCNEDTTAGAKPITLALRLADFRPIRPQEENYRLSTTRALTALDGKPIPEDTQLAAGKCVAVRVQVSKMSHAGLATAPLSNGNNRLIEMKAVRYDVPFNVKVDGPASEKVDVAFTRAQPGYIKLRNEDPMGYRFTWRLELGENEYTGEEYVDPKGHAKLPVTLSENYSFWESGFLRSGSRAGQLVLNYEPDPSFRPLARPQRIYPVAARLNYFGETGQRIWTSIFVMVVLLLGIVISMFINFFLPIQKTRVELKQKLADLEGKLVGLADTVDSRLLSLLRVEKKRLREELKNLRAFFPQTEVDLPKFGEKVDSMAKRIDLTAEAGELLASVKIDGQPLSVQEAEEIEDHCRFVFEVARKASPPEDEVKAAQGSLQIAAKILDEADGKPAPERVESLRKRQANVAAEIGTYIATIDAWKHPDWEQPSPPVAYATLTTQMLGGFQKNFLPAAVTSPPTQAPQEPNRADYVRHAEAVRQAELLVEFARLVETAGAPADRDSRLKRLPDLLAALRPGSAESIEEAMDIVRQTEENVSPTDIEEAMAKAAINQAEANAAIEQAEANAAIEQAKGEAAIEQAKGKAAIEQARAKAAIEQGKANAAIEQAKANAGNGQMWIETDPPTPLHLQLVIFRVRFKEPGLDSAVARKHIKCSWIIDGELHKELAGWIVGYFFHHRRFRTTKYRVQAKFTQPALELNAEVMVERSKSYVESRMILAAASLIVTILIVGFGLLASAQEKLQSLDWLAGFLAILLIGYTANALKNLVTRT